MRSAKDENQSSPGKRLAKRRDPTTSGGGRDTGSALRSIYQRTIDEDIPEEMLSLLRKLD